MLNNHDDVFKWKHFPRYWPLVRWIHQSLVNSPHKGQWHRSLMFSLICAWTNAWVNNWDSIDWRCHCTHYDIIVMTIFNEKSTLPFIIYTQRNKYTHIFINPFKFSSLTEFFSNPPSSLIVHDNALWQGCLWASAHQWTGINQCHLYSCHYGEDQVTNNILTTGTKIKHKEERLTHHKRVTTNMISYNKYDIISGLLVDWGLVDTCNILIW